MLFKITKHYDNIVFGANRSSFVGFLFFVLVISFVSAILCYHNGIVFNEKTRNYYVKTGFLFSAKKKKIKKNKK
jgi:hypothetical protein